MRSGATVSTVIVLCAGVWAGAVAFQQNRLKGELKQLLAGPAESLPTTESLDGVVSVAPTDHVAIINSPRDSLSATDMIGGGIAAPWMCEPNSTE